MYSLIETSSNYIDVLGTTIKGASYYICDDESDIAKLPTNKSVGIGSRALCIESGAIFMLSPSRVWKKYKGVSMIH